jgi:hypothetical protein
MVVLETVVIFSFFCLTNHTIWKKKTVWGMVVVTYLLRQWFCVVCVSWGMIAVAAVVAELG